jgi:hypothetical protein
MVNNYVYTDECALNRSIFLFDKNLEIIKKEFNAID